MKDILKKAISPFWEAPEDPQPTTQDEKNQSTIAETVVRTTIQGAAGFDQKIADMLNEAIRAADLKGYDYLEFRDAMQEMRELVPDEATRFRSAFASAKTLKVTANDLVKTAGHYRKVLVDERKEFMSHIESTVAQDVKNKIDEIKALDEQIVTAQKDIERLNIEISKAQDRKAKLSGQASEANVRIENTKNAYETTWTYVDNVIKEDIKKIRAYLGATGDEQ